MTETAVSEQGILVRTVSLGTDNGSVLTASAATLEPSGSASAIAGAVTATPRAFPSGHRPADCGAVGVEVEAIAVGDRQTDVPSDQSPLPPAFRIRIDKQQPRTARRRLLGLLTSSTTGRQFCIAGANEQSPIGGGGCCSSCNGRARSGSEGLFWFPVHALGHCAALGKRQPRSLAVRFAGLQAGAFPRLHGEK